MYINKDCKYIELPVKYEEVCQFLFQSVYNGKTVYVVDKEKHYKGCIGKSELIKSDISNQIIINQNSKYVSALEGEEAANRICRNNPKINNVPVVDERGRLIYEYCYEYKDRNELVLESLKNRGVTIGENVYILNCNIDYTWGWLITIGSNVTLSGVTILAHDASTNIALGKTKLGKVRIGDYVFVGYNSIILPDINIGNHVIVGAGTVVSKDIPDNSVVVGNPIHIIETYDAYIEKHKVNMKNGKVYDINPNDITWEDKLRMRDEINGIVYIN